MNNYFESQDKTYVTIEELWSYVQKKGKQNEKGYVDHKNEMKRVL